MVSFAEAFQAESSNHAQATPALPLQKASKVGRNISVCVGGRKLAVYERTAFMRQATAFFSITLFSIKIDAFAFSKKD